MVRARFMGSPKPVSASTRDGRSVIRAIWPARLATSGRVVRPMSGRPRSLASTAPEMYTPSKFFSSMSRADSGLNAPGNCRAAPGLSMLRRATRLSAGLTFEYSILEESFRCFRCVDVTGLGDDVELVEFTWLQFIEALDGIQEASDFGFFDDAFGKHAEFADVLLTTKWTSAQWVGVGNGDVVGDDGAIFHGDLYRTAEGLFVEVQRVVAASPFRIFYGRDLMPQFNGVFTLCTLWSIRINVVPCAIL